jgi:hypothetical protein
VASRLTLAAGQIAGFGVKLWPVVQDLTQLQKMSSAIFYDARIFPSMSCTSLTRWRGRKSPPKSSSCRLRGSDRRIENLHARVHRGAYRAQPSRPRHIPSGSLPVGIDNDGVSFRHHLGTGRVATDGKPRATRSRFGVASPTAGKAATSTSPRQAPSLVRSTSGAARMPVRGSPIPTSKHTMRPRAGSSGR